MSQSWFAVSTTCLDDDDDCVCNVIYITGKEYLYVR